MPKPLIVLRGAQQPPPTAADAEILTFDALRARVKGWNFLRHLGRYGSVTLMTSRWDRLTRPFATALLLRFLSFGHCQALEDGGDARPITLGSLLTRLKRLLIDAVSLPGLRRRSAATVAALAKASASSNRPTLVLGRPLYLRTDLWAGLGSGEAPGHVAGVLNHLSDVWGEPPVFITTETLPTASLDIETVVVPPDARMWDFPEAKTWHHHAAILRMAHRVCDAEPIAFVYQCHSLNSWVGVALSLRYAVPLVLEYHGADGNHRGLTERIEHLNLRAAHLIVDATPALKDELIARGLSDAKILVNPTVAPADPGEMMATLPAAAWTEHTHRIFAALQDRVGQGTPASPRG